MCGSQKHSPGSSTELHILNLPASGNKVVKPVTTLEYHKEGVNVMKNARIIFPPSPNEALPH